MRYFVDTGVLLRWFHPQDEHYHAIRNGLRLLRREKATLFTSVQNIVEFWNVSTRPKSARGGYGQSIESTVRRVQLVESYLTLLPIDYATHTTWKGLVNEHLVRGTSVHDARLVAAMKVSSVKQLITLNPRDFVRFQDVAVLTPREIPQRDG